MKKCYSFLFAALMGFPFAYAQPFQRVEDQAGLDHVSSNNGVAVADYDQDGDLDIFIVGYGSFIPSIDSTWNRLLRNKGDGTFEDATVEAGFTAQFINYDTPAERGEKMGASWGDYDNDAYPDLFLTNSRNDQLYHNNGDGTFSDVTIEAGVEGCMQCYSGSGLWWDYDRDGDLDLYVSQLNGPNIMFRNNKSDGKTPWFEDITQQMGLEGIGITWTAVALDVNNDGYPELYLANDVQPNQLFENESGGGFRDVSLAYRVDDGGAGMGLAIADYNNDGLFDLYVTNIYNHHPNPLYTNTTNYRFVDDAASMGVENTGWGWGTQFLDFDHDGDEDLFAVDGPIDKLFGTEQAPVNNFFYKNMLIEEGTPGFVDWSSESHTNQVTYSKGLEVFDYDQDGDIDMLVANAEEGPFFHQNQTIAGSQPSDKNWIQLRLEGTVSNRDAYGSKVKITIGDQSYYRYHHGAGFFSQSAKPVHFGVGTATQIDEIVVTWASGLKDTLTDVAVNQIIDMVETERELNHNSDIPVISTGRSTYSFPNPFQDGATLHFELPRSGDLTVKVYSSSGQQVFEATETIDQSGVIEIPWGGRDVNGRSVSSGIYFYRAFFENQIQDEVYTGKLVKVNQ